MDSSDPTQDIPIQKSDEEEDKPSVVWRYLGAMFTEKKEGVQAASFTRILGVVLFVWHLVAWTGVVYGFAIHDPPTAATYTLWGLIGTKIADTGTRIFASTIEKVRELKAKGN